MREDKKKEHGGHHENGQRAVMPTIIFLHRGPEVRHEVVWQPQAALAKGTSCVNGRFINSAAENAKIS